MREEHGTPLSTLTTMRVGGPAQRLVTAETTDELVDAVREVDDADEPLLLVSGGSNLVIADEGFAGLRGAGRHQRHHRRVPGRLRRGHRPGRRRRGLGRPGGPRRRRGLVRHRGAVRHPRLHRRHPDPERRRLRPGGRPDHRPGARLGPPRAGGAHLRQRRLRLHLPPLPLQGRARGTSCSTSSSSCASPTLSAPVAYADLARALGVEAGRAGAARGRPRGRAGPAAAAGHGAGRRRPRHVELRLVLHQPGPVPRALRHLAGPGPRGPGRRRAGPAAVRRAAGPGQDQRRVADRPGRLRQGLPHARPGGPVRPSTPSP